ncbi:MAG TPA: hypothetical protein VGZ02_05265 [Candidatus Baltobacteraceae bacterium]|jgi:hypothetical protein|nr:hypothetical protein [Candidatus Baltobacteraceae bacterium]
MYKIRLAAFVFALVIVPAAPALAGPPLICNPVAIGGANSLPWRDGNGWNGMEPSYNTANLVGDTLRLLRSSTDAAVQMETLRRAAIYSSRDPRLADQIATRLHAQMAWFDLGYFIESVRELSEVYAMIHDPAQRAAWQLRTPPPYIASLLAQQH